MTAVLEVVRLQPVSGAGALKATVRVRIGPVVIDGVRLLQQRDGAPWLCLPQIATRRAADGRGTGWRAVVTVDADVLDQLREAVISAWQVRL